MRLRDFLMFLAPVWSSFCLSSSIFRPVTPLFLLAVWLFACNSVNRFACCFCVVLIWLCSCRTMDSIPQMGLIMASHLPIVNFLYAYIETSTLKEILWDTADINECRRTQHTREDQRGLVKLVRVTLYWTYGDFDVWHFDTRNGFLFQVGGMRFLKQCLQALPPSPFYSRVPLAADPACCPLAFTIVLTDREPGTG